MAHEGQYRTQPEGPYTWPLQTKLCGNLLPKSDKSYEL